MINFDINGREFKIKTSLSELTLDEFDKYSHILFIEDFETKIDRDTAKLLLLTNLKADEIEDLPITTYNTILKLIDFKEVENSENSQASFEIGGVEYKSRSSANEYKLLTKEFKAIKKALSEDNTSFIKTIIAVIFKPNGDEDISLEAIAKRKEIFKDHITMELAKPYLLRIFPYILVAHNEGN